MEHDRFLPDSFLFIIHYSPPRSILREGVSGEMRHTSGEGAFKFIYIDITEQTLIQSRKVTAIETRDKCGLLAVSCTVQF
jgi:hypothetical protein